MKSTGTVLPRRMGFIDIIRGLAAILVYVFHQQIHTFMHYPTEPIPGGSITWWLFLGFIDLGKIAVTLFFCVSGYLIPSLLIKPTARIKDFAIHRIFRLYPAYWLSIICRLAVLAALGRLADLPSTFNIAVNFTMLHKFIGQPDLIGVFWTLQIELVFYIITAGLAAYRKLNHRWTIQLTMMGLTIICATGRLITHKPLPVAMFMALSLMWMADTMRAHERGETSAKDVTRAVISALIMVIPASFLGYDDAGLRYVITYYISIGLFVLCWRKRAYFDIDTPLLRCLSRLGDWSFGIYLLHGSVLILVGEAMDRAHYNVWITSLVTLPTLLVLSAILFHTVEAPLIRMGKRITAREHPL